MLSDPVNLELQLRLAAKVLREFGSDDTDAMATACEEAADEFYALACSQGAAK